MVSQGSEGGKGVAFAITNDVDISIQVILDNTDLPTDTTIPYQQRAGEALRRLRLRRRQSRTEADVNIGSPLPTEAVATTQQATGPEPNSGVDDAGWVVVAPAREEPATLRVPPPVRLEPQREGLQEDIPHVDLNEAARAEMHIAFATLPQRSLETRGEAFRSVRSRRPSPHPGRCTCRQQGQWSGSSS